jgi:APA family basic amino acid/polyamine antiporter
MPALFVLASAAIVLNALVRAPRPTAAGLAIILGGLPLYFAFRRRA